MALYASSSSSSSSSSKKYDVFISFRGEDTRKNFASHLHAAFCRKKIETFIDYGLPRGDDISSALMQAIEDSYVAVLVFSKNYASSRWCLEELAHIVHCKRKQGQLVIPVFYEVDPNHVRHQTGPYEQAFKKFERDLRQQHKVPNWREALNETANLAGWNSDAFRDDSKLIQNIVEDILQKLDHWYPSAELKSLVGIDESCMYIKSLLGETPIVGIWGMGGIGKTTIAKAMFSKFSSHFEGCCFLENVREFAGKDGNGLHYLRCKLLSKLLGKEITEESNFVKSRVSRMTVFIVLDDLSTLEQLEYLALDEEHHCFGPGSRIIITTRDKHVLSKGVEEVYEMEKLKSKESLYLLSLNAFGQSLPIDGYERLSERVVTYAHGIPLALKVLGSFLRGKSENEWNSTLSKLEKIPHEDIQNVLRISFNELNHEEREIFLDIACFLKGNAIEDVVSLIDSYGFNATIGIRALEDKALITIENGEYVSMHDLLQDMGREIIRQESIKEPQRRSRLWDFEEVYDMLAYKNGSNKVEGISLDVCQIKDLQLSADAFKKMLNLRFLKFYSAFNKGSSHLHLPKGLKFLPNKIGYLEWYRYPLKSLPVTFCPDKLVQLRMPNSQVQKLWDGVQDLVNLKMIDLSASKMLVEIPDFSKALKLEVVRLTYCESLCYVHSSILSLHSLVELVLKGCKKLKSLKSEIHLRSLTYLDVEECFELKEFSVSSEEIRQLNLHVTGIEILHPSVGRSSNMVGLYLGTLELKNIPNELSCLKALTELNLCGCQVINNSKLQILFVGLHSLRELYLDYCANITEVPNNIEDLLQLKILCLNYCKRLRSLPKLPESIKTLEAEGCERLERVMGSRPLKECRKQISFENCVKSKDQSLPNIIEDAFSYSFICLPGSRVPNWFRYRTIQSSIIIDIPPTSQLLGFALCVVQCPSAQVFSAQLDVACYLGDFKAWQFPIYANLPEMDSDHVYLWYKKLDFQKISKGIKRIANVHSVTDLWLSFRFRVESKSCLIDNFIKEIGVWPIYASEYVELVPQGELNAYNRRPRDADKEELLRQFKKLKL